MVDFGNSVFDMRLDSSVPLLNPVDDRSGETFAGALADNIDRFNKTVFNPQAKASQAEADKNGLFAEYAEEVGLIADAKDQGKFKTTDEAMRHIRVAQNKFLSNHPELTDDFFTFSNKLMTENGFGGSIVRESPEETGRRKYIEEGSNQGYDMSNPDSRAAYDQIKALGRETAALKAETDALDANGALYTARIKDKAVSITHRAIAATPQWVNDQGNKLLADLNGVTDPASRQAIIDQFKLNYDQKSIELRTLQSQGGVSMDYLLTGTDQMVKNLISVADGTSELATIETFNKSVIAKNQAIALMTSPKLARLVALDGLSKFQLPNLIQALDAEMINAQYAPLNNTITIDGDGKVTTTGKPPDMVSSPDEVAKTYNLVKSTVSNIVKDGYSDKEAVASQANQIVNLLSGAEKYGANDSDPRNFTATVDFFADPTVGKFIEDNSDLIYPQIAVGAKQVINQQYNEVVVGLINERWATASEGVLTGVGSQIADIPTSDIIEPVWNGVGIEFIAKPEYQGDVRIDALVESLNKGSDSVAGPLNKLIRASAHLSGNTDYEKVYNEEYKSRLWLTGKEGDKKPATGQEADKLSTLTNIPEGSLEAPVRPTDYTETPTTRKGQTGQLLDAIGAAEGSTYNTLFGYAERSGGDFSGTDITTMTVSDVQSLQKEMVKKNGISSAVGKYQFIQATLKEAIKGLGLKGDEKFTPELQDKLALWLLKNRTSYDDWATGTGDAAKFQNELASQWASIPNTSGKSAYAGDGVNNASAEGKRLIGML